MQLINQTPNNSWHCYVSETLTTVLLICWAVYLTIMKQWLGHPADSLLYNTSQFSYLQVIPAYTYCHQSECYILSGWYKIIKTTQEPATKNKCISFFWTK